MVCRADFPDRLNVLQQIQATNRQASSIDATPGELFPADSEEAALQRCVHTSCNIQARFLAPKPALPAFGQIKSGNALQTPARLPSLLQNKTEKPCSLLCTHACLPGICILASVCLFCPAMSAHVMSFGSKFPPQGPWGHQHGLSQLAGGLSSRACSPG